MFENTYDLEMADAGCDDGSYYLFDHTCHGAIKFESKKQCMEFIFMFMTKSKEREQQ